MKPFCPSNSSDFMALVENHCMTCCHEEYSRDPEADGERCPILTDIILGNERLEVIERSDGSIGCKHWKQWEGSFEEIEVVDPNQMDLFK